MAKKKKTTEEELQENLTELQNSYDRWNHLYENGGSDPFWSDGVNLDLVRNHIAYYKRNIKELCELTLKPLPALVLQDDPPKVSYDYYAKQEIIMANAQDVIARIESEYHIPDYDENSRFVKYFTGYKDSLEKGEWAAVRRCTYDYFKGLAETTEKKLHPYEENEHGQLGLFKSANIKPPMAKPKESGASLYPTYQTYLQLIQSQWQAFLECAAQVYKHKFPNQVMIYGQFPAATYVADEPTWKKVGRGLSIKAVAIVSIAQEKDRVVKHLLYDISQTVCYSLEDIIDANRFNLTNPDEQEQLRVYLVSHFKLSQDAGFIQAVEQLAAGTVALLSTGEYPPAYPELVATSTVFVLCQKLGLPYSADFTDTEKITDLKALSNTGTCVQACVKRIADHLETQIQQIRSKQHATVSRNEQQHTGTQLGDSQEPARQISLGEIRHPAENLHGGTPRGTALGADHGGHIDDAAAPQRKPTARIETLSDGAAGEKESPPNHQQLHGDSTAHELARPASGGTATGGTLQSRLDASNQTAPSSNKLDGVSSRQSFSPKARFMENTRAIRLLKEIESEGETATAFERHVLSKYAGWGGLSKGFDPNAGDWQTEYAELKELTGRIAKHLHPQVNIEIKGYQDTNYPDNLFHVAVGNVPFGEHKVYDERYNSQNFLIHDYFFAKTIDKVMLGGIVAFITSKGTMTRQIPPSANTLHSAPS